MRRFIRTAAIALICATLCTPFVDARGRKDSHPKQHRTEQSHRGKDKHGRPHGGDRGKHHKDHDKDRNKHGNHGSHGRPHGPNGRPPQTLHHSVHNRPSRPPQAHRPPSRPPKHPHMRPPRPYRRPTPPPPAWRPHAWRPINSILGVAFGTAVNLTVNALVNSGYNVSGYGNDIVYLSNVPMLNYSWPAATLHYSGGGLCGSEFVYSTAGFNMSRYNSVYNNLISVYGSPYAVQQLSGGGRRATWWGNDGQYITLDFGGSIATGGGMRYYTTLSFGR